MSRPFNYGKLQKTADDQIERFGDKIDIVFFEDVDNPAGAWMPPTRTEVTVGTKGVFTKATEKHAVGNLIHIGDQLVLVSGKCPRDLTDILGSLKRGTEVWKIEKIVPVKPGPLVMLYKVKVSQ